MWKHFFWLCNLAYKQCYAEEYAINPYERSIFYAYANAEVYYKKIMEEYVVLTNKIPFS